MIYRYIGGKSKAAIQKQIQSLAPKTYKEFREPFVGGGSTFFNIDQSIPRWINDLDTNLISVYLSLRDRYDQFIALCQEIEPHTKEESVPPPIYNKRMRDIFYKMIDDDVDPALKYYFVNRVGFSGRVRYDIRSRLYFSNPSGWNIIKTDKLKKASEILQNTKITCGSYFDLMFGQGLQGEDVWIYIDPPYYKNTLLTESSKLYAHNFTENDHLNLAANLKYCKHKFLLSYDNCDFIKNLYKDFEIIEADWTYCGTSSAKGQSKTKKVGQELFIKNY